MHWMGQQQGMLCWYPASDISLAEDNYRVVANELGMWGAVHGEGAWVDEF